jgi:ribosomal protein L18
MVEAMNASDAKQLTRRRLREMTMQPRMNVLRKNKYLIIDIIEIEPIREES